MKSKKGLFFRIGTVFVAAGLCVFTGRASAVVDANSPATDTNQFNFTGPEIFPIDDDIGLLHAADLTGDGLNDLIVVNNARSKINILYNQTGKTNLAAQSQALMKSGVNDLPPDSRFRIDSIASEKRITSLVVADLNGDGRPDLAYYGEPKELIVQYNLGTNGWSTPKRWPIDDGQLFADCLASGDLNGDGLTDLTLLGENCIYYLAQNPDHTLAEPEKIPYTGAVKAIQVLDVDGDGRDDLLLVNWDSDYPFRFRLQQSDGELGPEIYFSMPRIRAFCADNLESNKETQVVTIAQNSGRAAVSHFVRRPGDPLSGTFTQGQFSVLPLNHTDKPHRGMVWADINGDGLPDLLVAEPDSGQISVYFQKPDGTLAAPRKFSTLTGISDIAVADWEDKGRPDIFLLSADEHCIGVTRLDDKQNLPFPKLLPLDGRPLVMAAGPLHPGAKPTLAVILDQDGQRVLWTSTANGKPQIQKLSDDFKSTPTSMVMQDVNQDGLADLVVLIPYEKIKVLLQRKGKEFEETDVAPPGGEMDQPWCATADVDGDGKTELLLPQNNFLRAVVLQQDEPIPGSTNPPGWSFHVKAQINGTDSSSVLLGAAAVPNGTNAVSSIFLLDAGRKALTLCERDKTGAWQVVRNIELPPYTEYSGLSLCPLALGGTNFNCVGVMGQNAVAWQALHGDVWDIAELDSYETPIKDGYLNDVVTGDLNNDGRKDLVFMETAKNYLDLVVFNAQHKLVPASRWQVFEERTFHDSRSDLSEPREALVTDVTGDKKNDLVIIVHDRIIVYPQQ